MKQKITLLGIMMLFLSGNTLALEPDWSSYKAVLGHVKPGSKNGAPLMLMDYTAIKSDGSLDKAYLELSAFKLGRLASREEKLAFLHQCLQYPGIENGRGSYAY
ncbi:hypothetical protein MGMO_177c00190 [Methyloglobulus morosus KoM1]|uniref:Uncharacterized protein n=1 Tax=Methyloglobulus morosus KoM1 TaxID=1116472 RepID=V5BQ94_9GAMM|nr:hypothetical protein [Methyloglobulus morosus]ESS66728.1 hypothetical protein MGMO_177c00190 [Methyloglobulus morosus KoM1]